MLIRRCASAHSVVCPLQIGDLYMTETAQNYVDVQNLVRQTSKLVSTSSTSMKLVIIL